MNLTIETCANALTHAAMNRKAAIQVELAVGLCVFAMHRDTSKEARAMLNEAYAAAGYKCLHISEMDYKTVNRRINATAGLFEKLPVKKWIGHLGEVEAIRAVCEGLEPYELFTMQDVIRHNAPMKQSAAALRVNPNAAILGGPDATPHTGQNGVMQQFRRAADRVEKDLLHLHTEHLHFSVPKDAPKVELIDMAMQLMALAKESHKELLTA